jgi:hypothetical protein
MVGEVRSERKGPRGRRIVEWIKRGPNHYLDCEILQLAGFEAIRAFIFDVPIPQATRSPDQDLENRRQTDDGLWNGNQLEWK